MSGIGDSVAGRLARLTAAAPGRLSVCVRSDRGFRWGHDQERVVPAASTVKVAVLVALLRSGLPPDRPLPLPTTRVGGAGALASMPSVRELPARELARLMIVLSDNDATNALIAALDLLGTGRDALARVLAEAGTRHTVLERAMLDCAAVAQGRDNRTTAADLVALLVALRAGRLLDPAGTAAAVEVLRGQQSRDGLPAFLPPQVLVGAKSGMLPGLRHDLALLERADRWVAVAVTATDLADGPVDRGTDVLATFARIGAEAARLL